MLSSKLKSFTWFLSDCNSSISGTAILTGIILSAIGTPIKAATITGWNNSNAELRDTEFRTVLYPTIPPSLDISDAPGQIVYKPDEGESPGIKTSNQNFTFAGINADGCILAAGDVECDSPRMSGKRTQLQILKDEPIDLLFDVAADDFNKIYRVFAAAINNTNSNLKDFEISLGFGVGDMFVIFPNSDGLNFFEPTRDPIPESQLSANFPAGLFSPADQQPGSETGFFDDERSGFELPYGEDVLVSEGIFGNYSERFDDWLSLSQVPPGFFYDFDGNPDTDAELVAYLDGETWLLEGDEPVPNNDPFVYFTELTGDPVCSESSLDEPCYFDGIIEDLAKINLNFSIEVDDITNWPTYEPESQTAILTLRLDAKIVPEPMTILGSLTALTFIGFSKKRFKSKNK